MTFLELCEAVGIDSGLVSDHNIMTTVLGNNGRLGRIVRATAQAWEDIQNGRNDWVFMRAQFTGALVINQTSYTPAQLGIATRFRSFFRDADAEGFLPHTIYDASIGVSDESGLFETSPAMWRMAYGRGSQTATRPTDYALDGQNFLVGPKPDKAYVAKGWYRKSPQALVADADLPDMPAQYHSTIKWRAIMDLHGADAAFADRLVAQARYKEAYSVLVNDQTDPLQMGDALA